MQNTRVINTPIGDITLTATDGALTRLDFGQTGEQTGNVDACPLPEAERQLREYFLGTRKTFDLPLAPSGTPFQMRVLCALRAIPYGETRTYKDIAIEVGSQKGFRAVGMANHRNPIPIIIPCHRVIGADGSMTGFGGGVSVKEALLALEKAHKQPIARAHCMTF